MHKSFISMDLPEEEVKRQNAYFNATMEKLCNFTEDVKCWLSEAGHPYVVSNENDENESHETNETDDETDVHTGVETNENEVEMNKNEA